VLLQEWSKYSSGFLNRRDSSTVFTTDLSLKNTKISAHNIDYRKENVATIKQRLLMNGTAVPF